MISVLIFVINILLPEIEPIILFNDFDYKKITTLDEGGFKKKSIFDNIFDGLIFFLLFIKACLFQIYVNFQETQITTFVNSFKNFKELVDIETFKIEPEINSNIINNLENLNRRLSIMAVDITTTTQFIVTSNNEFIELISKQVRQLKDVYDNFDKNFKHTNDFDNFKHEISSKIKSISDNLHDLNFIINTRMNSDAPLFGFQIINKFMDSFVNIYNVSDHLNSNWNEIEKNIKLNLMLIEKLSNQFEETFESPIVQNIRTNLDKNIIRPPISDFSKKY